ncbi:MAG: alkaline phosphatase family protein, partial [Burkholderiales bacterium]|nr:alkaline phosphatase family protein [Burkholderiales bacterium]
MKSPLAPLTGLAVAALLAACAAPPSARPAPTRTIIMVWEGLRPDSIDAAVTPNLARLRARGVNFADHHASYPTLTLLNAASLVTGAWPRLSGGDGDAVWPAPPGRAITAAKTAAGARRDVAAPASGA